MKGFYVTTAIDYVNGEPHLGHAYEKIAADALVRFQRLQGRDAFLLVGTDEHSLNVAREAEKQDLLPEDYCDKMAEVFKQVYTSLNIQADRFVRTTEAQHARQVQEHISKLAEQGHVYKDEYAGYYCQSCEAFLEEAQLIEGKCPVHPQKEIQWVSEDNYFFALSRFAEPLLAHITQHPEFIQPVERRNEILNRIKAGLRDVSISRSTVRWGIPLPWDEEQAIYVWIDALFSYLSGLDNAAAKWWPADYHIVGKDIIWFHCVIWPAVLMALGLPLPKSIYAHGFICNSKGEKLSKSSGVVTDPVELADKYGVDVLRYYLLKAAQWGRDLNFSPKELELTYNNDLANDYGNLLSRSIAMVEKYCAGVVPEAIVQDESASELQQTATDALHGYASSMEALDFSGALQHLWRLVNKANKHVDITMPWALAKDPSQREELNTVLYNLLEALRLVTVCVSPVMPVSAERAWQQLGLPGRAAEQMVPQLKWGQLPIGTAVKRGEPLFPRLP